MNRALAPAAADPARTTVEDARRAILELANMKVRMICPDGRRRTISVLEARLIELTSPNCSRRIMCEDFIRQVRQALLMLTYQLDVAASP
ncbi:hypothetical protein SAMN02927924_02630 [Sphingobium faniae]|nr:hypothetical protein SAMN02927924_02630 [Sphingobium faniae]